MSHRTAQSKRPVRNAVQAASQFAVESLESRTFLSATTLAASANGRFVPTSSSVADVKNGPLAVAGATLANLYINYRKAQTAGTLSNWTTPLSKVVQIKTPVNKTKTVHVTIQATGNLNTFSTRMRALGMQVISSNTKYGVIGGYLPIARLRDAAADKSTLSISPVYEAYSRAQGITDNAADEGQNTDDVRVNLGLDGSNVSVGVLSDSVDRYGNGLQGSIGSGDLPSSGVKVLEDAPDDGTQTDEGRAMLELIHDIAPGAKLLFATATIDQIDFANNIRRLAAAGADVIVDDVGYRDEPYFQPGIIDQAIADVRAQGVTYLTAAGNADDAGFEQEATWTTSGDRTFIDFDPGTGVSTRMRITLTANDTMTMQWDNPFNGVVGRADADLVLRLYTQNATTGVKTLAYVADDNNLATGKPIESILGFDPTLGFLGINPGTYYVEIEAKKLAPGADLPTRYRFITDSLSFTQFDGIRSTVFGHSASEDAISVGAIAFQDSPAFEGDSISEDFSAFGPATQVFDANGNRLPAPVTLQKPDITGVDRTNTSFFSFGNDSGGGFFGQDIPEDDDLYPNFSGTSAAAPNVAAAVAQLLQADPTLTPDEIEALLETTAIPLNDQTPGEWDQQAGFGLIDALAAAETVIQPAVGDILPITVANGTSPVSTIYIKFNQLITGFTKLDAVLSLNGGSNLIDDTVSLTSTDGVTFSLNHLEHITTEPGTYTLTIDGGLGGLTDGTGAPFTDILTESFTILAAPAIPEQISHIRADTVNTNSIKVRWTDNQPEEDNFILERSTDSQFSSGYKKFVLGANTTQFTDTGLASGKRYYYRVSARNETGTGIVSKSTSAITLVKGEIILDNSYSTTTVSSGWSRRSSDDFFGGDYLTDANTGKGSKTVTFNPNVQQADEYYVYAKWPKSAGNAAKVPFTIRHKDDGGKIVSTVVYVNQQTSGGTGWVLLGKFHFEEGTGQSISISNAGTSGNVVIDSVRLLPSKVDSSF